MRLFSRPDMSHSTPVIALHVSRFTSPGEDGVFALEDLQSPADRCKVACVILIGPNSIHELEAAHTEELPREFRRSVPELDISIHVYDLDPQWRFVRINKQKFLEGDQVAKDLTLEAITPGGLVLVYQGTAFQLAKP